MRRRVEVTVETSEVIIVRQQRRFLRAYCGECAEQAIMVTVDQAAAVANKSSRLIYRMAEAGNIHFAETTEGFLLICLKSLISFCRPDVKSPGQDDAKDYSERASNNLGHL